MGHYVVESPLGPHAPGELIEITEEHVKKLGVSIERLLGLGAMREATKDDKRDPQSGEERQPTPLGVSADPDRTFRAVEPVSSTPAGAQPTGQAPVPATTAAPAAGESSSSSSGSSGSRSKGPSST